MHETQLRLIVSVFYHIRHENAEISSYNLRFQAIIS